jgi:serine/threonine-protein phosphatase PP1 catalytic subunit
MAGSGLDVDSVIERLLSVRGQPNNRTVQLAEGEIRALCATARCALGPPPPTLPRR